VTDKQLTPHFNLSEFRCPCCNQVDEPNALALATALEPVRHDFGPLAILSGYRCPKHNTAVKGKANSMHLRGLAADISTSTDSDRFALVLALMRHGFKRIGIGAHLTHADLGTTAPVIWTYYA
jgi:hypothetical protein